MTPPGAGKDKMEMNASQPISETYQMMIYHQQMAQQYQALLMQQMALSQQLQTGDQMVNPMAAFNPIPNMGMAQPGQADPQQFGMMAPGFMPMMFPGGMAQPGANNQMGAFNPFAGMMNNAAQPNGKEGDGQ